MCLCHLEIPLSHFQIKQLRLKEALLNLCHNKEVTKLGFKSGLSDSKWQALNSLQSSVSGGDYPGTPNPCKGEPLRFDALMWTIRIQRFPIALPCRKLFRCGSLAISCFPGTPLVAVPENVFLNQQKNSAVNINKSRRSQAAGFLTSLGTSWLIYFLGTILSAREQKSGSWVEG